MKAPNRLQPSTIAASSISTRQGLEEPHQQPGAERDREGRIDQHQRPHRVLQAEFGDDPRQRQEQQRRRHQVGQEDRDPQRLAVAARHARQAIAGRQRGDERDGDDADADDQRVQQPAREQRLLEQVDHVLERRRFVEPERDIADVVEIAVRLERGDQHPVERERRQDDEKRDGGEECRLAQSVR